MIATATFDVRGETFSELMVRASLIADQLVGGSVYSLELMTISLAVPVDDSPNIWVAEVQIEIGEEE